MNATELFKADGTPAGCFFCGKCRIVARTQEQAEQCCKPNVCACGAECRPYHTACEACQDKRFAAKERARFDAAEKVTEWSGPVCHGDIFGRDIDELEERLDWDDSAERPEYVWTCTARPVCHLDYGRIIEDATQEAYEDFDAESLYGEKELRAAIEAFNAANTDNVCWEIDYSRALVLDKSNIHSASENGK